MRLLAQPQWLQPSPISPPTVDPQLLDLHPVARAAESIRFFILELEWWTSPNGLLRQWVRIMIRMALFLSAPMLLLAPLIMVVLVWLLKCVVVLTTLLWKLIMVPILVVAVVLVTRVCVMVLKAMSRG